jgi:hypothetical protein
LRLGKIKLLIDSLAHYVHNAVAMKRRAPKQSKTYEQKYKRMKVDPSMAFPWVEKMLYKMAWQTTHIYNIPFDETRSEVMVAYMKACWRWTPGRGEFSTLCCFIANCRLRRLVMDRTEDSRKMPQVPLDVLIEQPFEAPPVHSECLEMIEDLSEDAREIVSLLLEIPQELVGTRMTPRQLMKAVKRYMIKRRGKDEDAVHAAHKELQLRFSEAWA